MTSFEMVKYHGQDYPDTIPLRVEEIAAHFDAVKVRSKYERSLHTEYSYGKRRFDSDLVRKYPELVSAQREGVPQLWKNELWALQFADFVIDLARDGSNPVLIEVHPPFNDYTDIKGFTKSYTNFEEKILEHFPDTQILIENRCGSIYHGGKFLISRNSDISVLCEEISSKGLKLKIAYDVPQIYTAHNAKSETIMISLLDEARTFRNYIGGVHLWGKKLSKTGRVVAHCGDLNSYFGDRAVKEHFLQAFKRCFDDSIARKIVLEVNSGNEDLKSIVNDLSDAGIHFI